MYFWKLCWGFFLLFLLWRGYLSFVRHAKRSPDVVYNWFGVTGSFLTVGLLLYVIFVVQP